MYAKIKDGQLFDLVNGTVITINGCAVANPTKEMLAAQGYYLIPNIDDERTVASWELVDGALIPSYAPIVPPNPSKDIYEVSKYKLLGVLKSNALLTLFLSYLSASGNEEVKAFWDAAQELDTSDAMFRSLVTTIAGAVGKTEAEVYALLWEART